MPLGANDNACTPRYTVLHCELPEVVYVYPATVSIFAEWDDEWMVVGLGTARRQELGGGDRPACLPALSLSLSLSVSLMGRLV